MNYQDMLAIFQNAGYMGLYGGLDVEKPFSFFAIVDSEYGIRIIHKSQETLNLRRFLARFLLRDNRMTIILEKFEIHSKKINSQ